MQQVCNYAEGCETADLSCKAVKNLGVKHALVRGSGGMPLNWEDVGI